MKKWLLLFSSMLIMCFTLAQEKKLEKEERIKPSEAPDGVKEMVSPYTEDARRVRYYSEFDGTSTSYEVKFILHKNKFSVEFSKDGQLEDVEVIRCFTDMPTTTQNNIVDYLYPNDNFKIKKSQKQFRPLDLNERELLDAAIKNKDIAGIRYELIVQVKKDGDWTTYEMLFDEEGRFISQREVVARSEDHLLY